MANTSAKTFTEYLDGSPLFALDNVTGQVIPQTSELKDAWTTLIKNIFGDIDTTDETPIGRLIEALAIRDARACAITASYANQINPNYATGRTLDAIASLFNVQRNSASQTIIAIQVAGVSGVVIPSGSKIKNNKGQTFSITNDIEIAEGGVGHGYAISEEFGEIEIENGSVTTIVDAVENWNSVTNTGIYMSGTNIETDASLRGRVVNSRWTGTSFTESILSAVERVNGMRSAIVIDNGYGDFAYAIRGDDGNVKIVYDEPSSGEYIKLNPHSVLIVAYSAGNDNDIAEAIFNTKSAGCGYTSISDRSVTKYVMDKTSFAEYPVIFNKPQTITFGVKVTVRKNRYTGTDTDLENEVKNAIINWSKGGVSGIDGLQIGQSIYSYEIGAAISDKISPIQIKSVVVFDTSDMEEVQSIDVFIDKIGILDESNITVEIK